jgi:hypothetical protein
VAWSNEFPEQECLSRSVKVEADEGNDVIYGEREARGLRGREMVTVGSGTRHVTVI